MKKIFFYFFLIISLIFLVQALRIIILDLPRLTPYGYGYLGGKVILFLVFLGISLWLRKSIKKSKTQS